MARKPNPDRDKHLKEVAKHHEQGLTRQQSADALGMSKSYVGELRHELGLTRQYNKPNWRKKGVIKSRKWLETNLRLHDRKGTSLQKTAEALGISEKYVSFLRKEMGLTRKKRQTTAEEREQFRAEILELRKTLTVEEIAQLYDVSDVTIYNWLNPNRKPRPVQDISEAAQQRKAKAIQLKDEGKKPSEIAKILDVHENTVNRYIREHKKNHTGEKP